MSESNIDTSKMSKEKAAALEIAEAGRDNLNKNFAGDLFFGDADFNKIYPYPTSSNTKESNTFPKLKYLRAKPFQLKGKDFLL